MAHESNLELDFEASERTAHHVRLMVQSFTMLAAGDHVFASRVTVTCAELVESAARRLKVLNRRFRLHVTLKDRHVRAELFTEPSENEAVALESAVSQACRGTPTEAYSNALTGGDKSDDLLGLARVRYEGQMQLSGRREGARFVLRAESRQG